MRLNGGGKCRCNWPHLSDINDTYLSGEALFKLCTWKLVWDAYMGVPTVAQLIQGKLGGFGAKKILKLKFEEEEN